MYRTLLTIAIFLSLLGFYITLHHLRNDSYVKPLQLYLTRSLQGSKPNSDLSRKLSASNDGTNYRVHSSITVVNRSKGPKYTPLSDSDVREVTKFVLFIGYPRSGHSIFGSIMDGHPNVILAHEYNLFAKCSEFSPHSDLLMNRTSIFNALYRASAFSARNGWRSESVTSKGYNLHTTSWQGTFKRLRVVGDKCGGKLARYFYQNYTVATLCYRQLSRSVQVPILFFHIVRNPFDMIATALIRKVTSIEDMKKLNLDKVYVPLEKVQDYVTSIFNFAKAVERVKHFANVYEIHLEDFVRDPRKCVQGICRILELPCPPKFTDNCYEKAYKSVPRTRDRMIWDPVVKSRVEDEMKNFSFFSRYSFKGN